MTELILLVLILTGWLICGVFAYANDLAYFQRKYPTVRKPREDTRDAVVAGLFGPIALLVGFRRGDWKYGLQWRALPPDYSDEAYAQAEKAVEGR